MEIDMVMDMAMAGQSRLYNWDRKLGQHSQN
jgi:hypothetical protein